MKPFAESSEQNKHAILTVLHSAFSQVTRVLEIGSGTGQHAVFFAQQLPHLTWQTSDVADNLPGISAWIADADCANSLMPMTLDVNHTPWPDISVDGAFSANTAHIMHWPSVQRMLQGIGAVLSSQGVFCLYGPFNYQGAYTSNSNAQFDIWLKTRDPNSGIRDFEALNQLAEAQGLLLLADHSMPANNRTLVWRKQ